MFKTKQSLISALPLLCLSLFPYSAVAQTSDGDGEPFRSNAPSAAQRIGVQEVGIQDFVFDKPQPRQLPEISVKRELEVKFVPPPDRQNTVYDNTEGVQVQIRPQPIKSKTKNLE
ncbi:MAG: hypothetical protein ACFCU8_06520 [Thermosynechococcaceae cyanobacterium]